LRRVTHNGREKLILLEVVLQLHGEFRRSLEPIRVTPLQAGVLLFLCRHAEARVTDIAAALGVRLSTLSGVVTTLARKGWIGHTTITLTVLEIQTAGGSMEL
jgi:DNA-binding MarR family transcriptional regulator